MAAVPRRTWLGGPGHGSEACRRDPAERGEEVIGEGFTIILLNPLVNLLVLLSHLLFNSFGLAIIAFTILIRAATFPLTLRQIHTTRSMQQLQPRIAEINKKYSDPKRRQEEV